MFDIQNYDQNISKALVVSELSLSSTETIHIFFLYLPLQVLLCHQFCSHFCRKHPVLGRCYINAWKRHPVERAKLQQPKNAYGRVLGNLRLGYSTFGKYKQMSLMRLTVHKRSDCMTMVYCMWRWLQLGDTASPKTKRQAWDSFFLSMFNLHMNQITSHTTPNWCAINWRGFPGKATSLLKSQRSLFSKT